MKSFCSYKNISFKEWKNYLLPNENLNCFLMKKLKSDEKHKWKQDSQLKGIKESVIKTDIKRNQFLFSISKCFIIYSLNKVDLLILFWKKKKISFLEQSYFFVFEFHFFHCVFSVKYLFFSHNRSTLCHCRLRTFRSYSSY